MIAIAVDDERPMLTALQKAVQESEDIEQVYEFGACSEALQWVEENTDITPLRLLA